MAKRFLKCNVCGQIIEVVQNTGVPTVCCGEVMEEIYPKTEEGPTGEKHIPVFKIKDNKVTVQVGSMLHPSTTEHYIEWITLVTNKGSQTKMLKPGDSPVVTFYIAPDERVKEIYEYCNIHSLWKVCVKDENKREHDME